MKKNIILLTIFLTISSLSSNAALTGDIKDVFTTSFYDTCLKNDMPGFKKAQIEFYCICSKNYMVKHLNEEDIFEMEGISQNQSKESVNSFKAVQLVKKSAAYCMKKIK